MSLNHELINEVANPILPEWAERLFASDDVPTFSALLRAAGVDCPVKMPDLLARETLARTNRPFLVTDDMVKLMGIGGAIKEQRRTIRTLIEKYAIQARIITVSDCIQYHESKELELLQGDEIVRDVSSLNYNAKCIVTDLHTYKEILLQVNTNIARQFRNYLIQIETLTHLFSIWSRRYRERQSQRFQPSHRPRGARVPRVCAIITLTNTAYPDYQYYWMRGTKSYIRSRFRNFQTLGVPYTIVYRGAYVNADLFEIMTDTLRITTHRNYIALCAGYSREELIADVARLNV